MTAKSKKIMITREKYRLVLKVMLQTKMNAIESSCLVSRIVVDASNDVVDKRKE